MQQHQTSDALKSITAYVSDDASDELAKKASENSDVPVREGSTSQVTISPAQAAKELEDAARQPKVIPSESRSEVISPQPRVQVLILQDTSYDSIGYVTPDGRAQYCCTQQLFDQYVDGCNAIGTLIVKGGRPRTLMSAYFLDGSADARLSGENAVYNVEQTGEHILILSHCDARLQRMNIQVNGGSQWMNPYGYLPGRLFGFLPFYFAMFVIYFIFTLTWGVLCFKHRRDIAGIQHFISIALGLTLIEVMAWFIDYYNFNTSGVRQMSGVIAAIVVTVLRLTVSRMLVVSVSIGYPVVRPSLSAGTKFKIACLGILYFACESALEVVTRYAQTNETAESWRIFLSIPDAVLNAIFYWWIFTALHDLINYLEQENQAIKLAMYKTFTQVLAASLVAAVLFAIYQMSAAGMKEREMEICMYCQDIVSHPLLAVVLVCVSFSFVQLLHGD